MTIKSFAQLARVAYEAHATAQANRTGRGLAIHPWEALKPADQASWIAAAKAVVADVSTVL